jgi:hypothetical protein
VERNVDLEVQMRQSMGDRERVLEGVLERARERRWAVRWGGGWLVSLVLEREGLLGENENWWSGRIGRDDRGE